MAFVKLSTMPAQPTLRIRNVPSLSGGLNLSDAPWNLKDNQSPEMKNLWWEDGVLRSRPAQTAHHGKLGSLNGVDGDYPCDSYPQPYKGWYVFRRANAMYAVSEDLRRSKAIDTSALVWQNPETGKSEPALDQGNYGTFFLFDGRLYYKAKNIYAVIEENRSEVVDEELGLYMLAAKPVEPFIPTLLINADPGSKGAGDLYQPINRLSDCYDVLYNTVAEQTVFITPLDATAYENGTFLVESVSFLNSDGTWNELTPEEQYSVLPLQTSNIVRVKINKNDESLVAEAGVNNVRIRIRQSAVSFTDAKKAFDACNIVEVYGGGEGLCAVFAGSEDQPNAYFWSANTDIAMDPTYIPQEHCNIVGSFDDPIVALGTQQNDLVIFQKRRVGKATLSTADIDGRTFITMNYSTINAAIGCDIPKSVQLIENNLVFANSRLGVLQIQDTSSSGENVLRRISENVEGDLSKHGLIYDLQNTTLAPTSFDDGQRYWLVANGHAWLWDYRLNTGTREPQNLAWFYFDNMKNPVCWFGNNSAWQRAYIGLEGMIYTFTEHYPAGSVITNEDLWWRLYGEDFESVLSLPVQNFGTYEVRKDVIKAIFVFDDTSEGQASIEYQTDGSTRTDRTPIDFSVREDTPFSEVYVRRPRCLGVRHFLCRLRYSGGRGKRMAFASAQIFYTYKGEER